MTKGKNHYSEFVKEYQEILQPLFEKALEVSEFNLIMSLLAFRGMSDGGWDPYENTQDVFEEIYKNQKKFSGSLQFNMHLWLYLHLIECSEHYELVANLINTTKGKDYVIANHRNRNFVNLKVEQKINRLKAIARGTDFTNVAEPFEKTFNARFRNAIGHADYAIKSSGRTGVTVADDDGFPVIFSQQEANDLINRAVALHVVLRRLSEHFRSQYGKSVVIKSSPGFGGGQPINVTLIVRKNHGVIGFRCIGGYDMGKPFETRIVTCLPYEMSMIEAGINDLPQSRVDRANKVLNNIPRPVAKRASKVIRKMYKV
jgi:hypothetical protein